MLHAYYMCTLIVFHDLVTPIYFLFALHLCQNTVEFSPVLGGGGGTLTYAEGIAWSSFRVARCDVNSKNSQASEGDYVRWRRDGVEFCRAPLLRTRNLLLYKPSGGVLTPSDSGTYTCEVEYLRPPPFSSWTRKYAKEVLQLRVQGGGSLWCLRFPFCLNIVIMLLFPWLPAMHAAALMGTQVMQTTKSGHTSHFE